MWDRWETFLVAVATLDPPRPLSRAERWRFPHLTALASALDLQNTAIDGVNHALTTGQALLPAWTRAAARAASPDLSAISAGAADALQAWPDGNHDVI